MVGMMGGEGRDNRIDRQSSRQADKQSEKDSRQRLFWLSFVLDDLLYTSSENGVILF
jgi:hypothetical protein